MKEVEEGTRVKETYNRSEVSAIDVSEDSRLTKEDVVSSFASDVFRISFSNEGGDAVFPVEVKRHNNDVFIVELEDGGRFEVTVSEITYK